MVAVDRLLTAFGIELDARDIKEITYRRLLTKSPEGEGRLRGLFSIVDPKNWTTG